MAIIDVNPVASPRIVTVLSPDTAISIQELYDLIRDWEDDNLSYDPLESAGGKEDLGGGVQVGITLTLLNAKLAFEARPGPSTVQCNVSGGNLVAVDDLGATFSPIEPTAFTQVVIAQSTSASISQAGDLSQIETDVAAIKVKTDNLPGAVPRGVQLSNFHFWLLSGSTPVTGASPVVQVLQDGGTFTTSTNAAVEVGFGVYRVTLTATEMNAEKVSLLITASGADTRFITIVTSP